MTLKDFIILILPVSSLFYIWGLAMGKYSKTRTGEILSHLPVLFSICILGVLFILEGDFKCTLLVSLFTLIYISVIFYLLGKESK